MVKDYLELGAKTPISFFSKKVAEKALKVAKTRVPFCEPCARLDFRDTLESFERENERTQGFMNTDNLKLEIDKFDLDKYVGEKYFDLIEEQDDVQDKFIDGTMTRVTIGRTKSFKCKKRGHGVSVFVPQNEMIVKKEKQ